MGEKEKAIATFERYATAQPGDANPLDSMGDLFFLTGDFGKARAKYQQALAVKSDFPSIWKLAYLYAMDGDYAAAIRWVDTMIARAQTEGMKADGHQWKGMYYSLQGRFKEALAEQDEALVLAKASGNTALADIILRDTLWICYDWDRLDLFKTNLEKRMVYRAETKLGTESLNKNYELLYTGLYDLKTGNIAAARKKLDEMMAMSVSVGEKEKGYDRLATTHLKREVLFAEGDYDGAIKAFQEGPPMMINLSAPMTVQGRNLPYLADFAARVYLKKGDPAKAIKEYERLISTEPSARESALLHPFSRLRLAALYEAAGHIDLAIGQYESLLGMWKHADPGLPEVMTVRKKLDQLKGMKVRPKGATVEAFFSVPFIGAPSGF
jgi:tetratricopeptide (TPR) repeat protein